MDLSGALSSALNFAQFSRNLDHNDFVKDMNYENCQNSQDAIRRDQDFIREHHYSSSRFSEKGARIVPMGDVFRVSISRKMKA